MSRNVFLDKILKFILLSLLTLIVALLGRRTVSGQNCSECSGKGLCKGESDCSSYLQVAK